jgi:transcriptional regulator with XRE-family HTH domain
MIPEEIGKRIAQLRQQHGWTQQTLADRLAISRVAVSHIEMDISVPGERTIALLAGLFKMPPHELVTGTTYPKAKSDRLPRIVCMYTELEKDIALLSADLDWLQRLTNSKEAGRYSQEVIQKWSKRLSFWDSELIDEQQRTLLEKGRQALDAFK